MIGTNQVSKKNKKKLKPVVAAWCRFVESARDCDVGQVILVSFQIEEFLIVFKYW